MNLNTEDALPPPLPPIIAGDLEASDLRAALAAGWRDFLAFPLFGLFFASIFVIVGILLTYFLLDRGEVSWLIPVAAGFPILAPFTAVGLYEVSRRREAGLAMTWPGILGALRGRGDEQIMSMGVIIFVAFAFWIMVAHGIFAIFLAQSGLGSESLEFFLSDSGLMMLAIGSAIGAVMAFAFYSITVISLPMLVDREVDFLTAMIASIRTIKANTLMMIIWAAFIAAALFIAMLPAFLGLLVVLPVLGHATWHLYRRVASSA